LTLAGLRLFLKSRRTSIVVAGLVAVSVIGRVLGPQGFLVGDQSPIPLPWVVLLPVVAAYIIAAASVSPVPWLELLAQRPVAAISRCYLSAAIGLAVLLLWWATARTPPPVSTPAAIRAFLGLLGLSLVCVGLFGVTAGWLPPAGLLFAAIFVRSGGIQLLPIDWPVRDDGDLGAWVIAIAMLVVGVGSTWTRWFQLRNASD